MLQFRDGNADGSQEDSHNFPEGKHNIPPTTC